MLHSLTARTLLMAVDHKISIPEAINWILRKMPTHLRHKMSISINKEIVAIMLNKHE